MAARMKFKLSGKFIAVFAALMMILNVWPWQSLQVSAFNPDQYKVDSVTVFKVYDANRNLEQRRIMIMGSYLKDAAVGIITSTGYQELTNRTVNLDGLLQFDMSQDQLGNSVLIEGVAIELNEGEMPTLTGINRKVKIGVDNLILQGTNLTRINDTPDKITAGYEHEGAYTPLPDASFNNDSSVTIVTPSGALGYQNIIFEKKEILTKTFNPANQDVSVTVTIKYTYKDQFKFVQDLNVEGLEMRPNRGEKGEKVFFEAPNPNLDNYDVFFLKEIDGTDIYTNANKGKNKTFQQNIGGRDILTVEVPDLPVGEYYVILTNPVSEGLDPMKAIVQEMVVGTAPEYEKFTIIDASVKSRIISVQPDTGPDTGSKTTISGQFLVSLNVPEYIPDDSDVIIEDPAEDSNPQELLVSYAPGTYNGIDISSVQRRIRIIIGGTATFLTNNTGTQYDVIYNRDLDRIAVQTPQVTDADLNPVKDVVVETETIFTKQAGGTIVIKERAELPSGYTYIPSKVAPVIDSVSPEKIQVVRDGDAFKTPEDRIIAIYGKNFMVHKFIRADGVEVVRYPIVEFGPEIGLNKNSRQNPGDPASDPSIMLRVFDSTGKELDGTEGNELGTKILVTIPGDKVVTNLGKAYIKVSNPVRNSENTGLSTQKADYIEFVSPDVNKNPVITSVTPNVVTIDGREQITIEGSNFATGVKVFLDGEEIKTINRQGDGKKITFTCPKGREGETQLQVMNIEGGMDTWPFIYVKTYTNPKITDFSPKSGNTGTLVIITGENFLKPEPTATESSIYKLIGTRVVLEGIEVNEYNLNTTTKMIELRDYTSPSGKPVLEIADDSAGGKYLKIADYYSGIILEDISSHRFYTLDVNARGNIILSDGAGNNYILLLGTDINGNPVIKANKEGGNIVELAVNNTPDYTTITIGETSPIVLKLRTLYKVDQDGNIVGNRVKVVDMNHIYFTVPILEADGYYDMTVINPDTKKDSKLDNQGFYYYGQPQSKPVITGIYPNEGSVEGGYTITISGSQFEDNGTTKSKVFINGVEVNAQDTVVSTDGTSVVVKVPKYPGDLIQEKGTSRLTVPVVVVNPDGGSFSMEDGFTYVVPGSHPQISKIVPQKGFASGGDVVEITGTDFRYYEPYDDANRNQIRDPDESFNNINRNKDALGNPIWDSEQDLLSDPSISEQTPLQNNSRYFYYYASPILPKVFFGSNQAKIVEFSRGYIKVIVPEGTTGETGVFLVNNDSGISNKVKFTYEASNPKIDIILPAQGTKQGKDRVEITGSGFVQSTIEEYLATVNQEDGNNEITEKTMPLVRFGSITNRKIPREQENSGRIDSARATVNLEGGLKIEYNGLEDTLKVSLEYNGTYEATVKGYDDSIKYIPLSILKDSRGNSNKGYELVRVEVSDRRLLVDRGYSPQVEYVGPNQLVVYTPSYYTIGKVPVAVVNPDGGVAAGGFEYKNPASNPKIISITRENQSPTQERIGDRDVRILRMSYKGGNIVSITGEDFRENAGIQISNVATITKSKITYSLPNKLTFQMPAVPETAVGKMYRVVVLNEDGGSAFSDELSPPIYIIFIKGDTAPAIEKVTPDKGSSNGGTRVKIEGKDFRERMEGSDKRLSVYFGEIKVPDSDVTVVDYKTIYVIAPSNTQGEVKVRIENPDGVISDPGGTYTYLSSPKVIAVVDPADPTEATRINTISVEGGQEVKLKGSGYLEGAKIVFNPVIKKIDDETMAGGEVIYIEGQPYELESGAEGTDVKFIDSETLTVTTPQGRKGAAGIIVVNPDGGASDVYGDLTFDIPQLPVPAGVQAELVYDRYIKVTWKGVSGAREYEIYVVIDDNETELAGSTQLSSFVYTDLEPRTRYKFIVKAVGDFGPSKPSEESNMVKTGSRVGPPDDDGRLNEKTRTEKSGSTANVTIGEKDFDDKVITIDMTRGILAGSKEVIISIPASAAASKYAKDITIIGKDFKVKFNPNAFNVSRVKDNKDRKDAGVRLQITPFTGSADIRDEKTGGTPLSTQYMLEASIFVGRDSTQMDYLNSVIEITLDFDAEMAEMRRLVNISLSHYDGYNGGWTVIGYGTPESTAVTALTGRLGRYVVIGRRR